MITFSIDQFLFLTNETLLIILEYFFTHFAPKKKMFLFVLFRHHVLRVHYYLYCRFQRQFRKNTRQRIQEIERNGVCIYVILNFLISPIHFEISVYFNVYTHDSKFMHAL